MGLITETYHMPCQCGHDAGFHSARRDLYEIRYGRCGWPTYESHSPCQCPGFKRDNLVYLERLSVNGIV